MSDRAESRSLRMKYRFENWRIAVTKVTAIFFLMGCFGTFAQGSIKVFLFDEDNKALLVHRKVGVQVNDSVSTMYHYSDTSGRVVLSLPPGKYNLAIKPEGYELMKVEDVIVKEGVPTYLTYAFNKTSAPKKKRRKRNK